ncbi:MAG: isopropylmalate isomerase [Pseudomonadota bacterium]
MSDYTDRLFDCVFNRWTPTIGDPSIMGWVTVGGYFAAAAIALAVVLSADRFPEASRRREQLFWTGVVLFMIILGINKQLDLQSFFTATGRCVSKLGGWYEDRQPVQATAVLILLTLCLLIGVFLLRLLRGVASRYMLALAGVVFIAAFILVRAVGFTHMDALINTRIAGWRMNWVLELGGILLLAAGAIRILALPRPRHEP